MAKTFSQEVVDAINGLYSFTTPLPVTITQTFTLGSITASFNDLDNIRRKSADLDGATVGFLSLENYQVPTGQVLVIGHTIIDSDKKNSVAFGYADDAIGTNFVELISETILTPSNSNSSDSDFIFSIPTDKFPLVNIISSITIGFFIIEGIENVASAQIQELKHPEDV